MIYQRIFEGPKLFESPPQTIEFLRYMHNFAGWVTADPYSATEVNEEVDRFLQTVTTVTVKPTRKDSNKTQNSNSRVSKTSQNEADGKGPNVLTDGVMEAFATLGLEVLRASVCSSIVFAVNCLIGSYLQKNVIWVSDESNCAFVAKLISRGLEDNILDYLISTPDSRNHTIPMKYFVQLAGDRILIVMPQHTVLDKLKNLDQEVYYQLRRQLVEVRRHKEGSIQCPHTFRKFNRALLSFISMTSYTVT